MTDNLNTKLSLLFVGNEETVINLHEGTMEVKGTIATLNSAWTDLSDRVRLEMIKSLIWTAPDMHIFHTKVEKLVTSNKFKNTLD